MEKRLFALLFFCAVLLAGWGLNLVLPPESDAVPSFARTMGMSCNTCHTQWPLLNEAGRIFHEQGFDTGESLTVDKMSLQKAFPVSARLNFRLIDKRTSKDKTSTLTDKDKQLKLRGLHEGEVFVAGRIEDFSYFFELEAEDEWPDPAGDAPGFQIQLAHGYAGWHLNPAFNVRAGYMSPYGADGRNTVSRTKPARYQWAASSKGFVPGDSQVISVDGIAAESLFYSLAWHGNDGDLEGHDAKDFSGRLAYDFARASVGGFYTASKAYNSTTGKSEDKTNKYGLDAQWLYEGLQVNAIYAVKNVDVGDIKDDLIGIFALYMLEKEDLPLAVAVNLDRYSENDGTDDWTKGALFLSYFPMGNVKFQVGWEGTLSAPDAYENKESRITLVADMGF